MAFAKLNRNNFTRTKITNKSFVKYRASDETNLQKDFSLNSKNIVNTEFTVDLNILDKAIEKYNSGINEENQISSNDIDKTKLLEAINGQIQKLKERKNKELRDEDSNNFYDNLRTITGIGEQENLSNFDADDINAPKFFKFVLSELFVSNEFKIKRVGQKFLPYSDELSKKNFIRDKLYRYYSDQIADADHKNVSYTFTNYNTLNFQQIGGDKHANAVVYPNPYTDPKHGYEFLDSNNFNISFWINKRQTNNEDEAQCLLHIPYFLSLYTVDKSSTGYSFLIRCGDNANSYFNINAASQLSDTDDAENLTSVSSGVQFGNGKLLTNHWHNISINFLNSESSGILILFYIDGQFIGRNLLNNNNNTDPKLDHSLICLGNKPRYKEAENVTFDSLYTQFFAKIKNTVNSAYGPFYNKDISLGKLEDIEDPTDFNTIDNKFVPFAINNGGNTVYKQQFEGEIHDIRIYKQNISETKIKDVYTNIVSNLEDEINNFGLDFYVPVFYVADEVRKNSIVNLYDEETTDPDIDISKLYYYKYNHIYNPVLANYCGGFELSVENYLIEFVKETKPNVVIGGDIDVSDTSINNFFHGITDYITFKNIKTLDSNNNSFKEGKILFEEFYVNSNSINSKYYNSLILPNDNGIPNYSTNSIEYLVNNNTTLNINTKFYFLQQLWNKINLTDTQNLDAETHEYFNISTFLDYANSNLENSAGDDIVINDLIGNKSTKDLIFDISNHYYHVKNFNDQKIAEYKNRFQAIYDSTNSNPAIRNISSSPPQNADSTHVDGNEFASYQKFNLPYYDINKEDCNFFNVYFDITNNLYGDKIQPNSLVFKNIDTNYKNNLIFKDNGESGVYRANCLSKQAKWSIVGNLFYNEGILSFNNPAICYIGLVDFEIDFKGEHNMFVSELNIPLRSGEFDFSNNKTHDSNLRHDINGINSAESFVYITDVHLHDENYNIIANAKLAHPIPKKPSDKFIIRLKMDY